MKIAVAKAVDGKLSPVNRAQKSEIGFSPRTEGTYAFVSIGGRPANISNQFTRGVEVSVAAKASR